MTGRRAGIYARISLDNTGEALGVQRQTELCRARAAQLGWTVAATYVDNSVSAYTGKARPAYTAMLDAIEAGTIDAVLVYDLDRLTRRPVELERFIELVERHGTALASVDREVDLATDSGRLFARIKGAVARNESERKAQRTRDAQRQAAKAGRFLGGVPPYGWRTNGNQVQVDPHQASVVAWLADQVIAGATLGGLAAELNRRGEPTPGGRAVRWRYQHVRNLLVRPRNAGIVTYGAEGEIARSWPPILAEDTYRGVVAILGDPARRVSDTSATRRLLVGLAVCGKPGCGQPVRTTTARAAGGGYRPMYRCPQAGGGHARWDADRTDEYVARVVVGVLGRPDWAAGLASRREAAAGGRTGRDRSAEANTLRARLDEANAAYADGQVGLGDWSAATARIRGRLVQVQEEAAQASAGATLAPFTSGDVAATWSAMPVDRRRAVVRELCRVTLLPGSGSSFDPDYLRLEWLTGPDR